MSVTFNQGCSGFVLTKERIDEIEEWKKSHDCSVTTQGAIGGKYTYEFTPTGLGVTLVVRCACGQWKDFTKYEDW